jgi:PAS domain S-box-containing protein
LTRNLNEPADGWWEPLVQVSLDGQFVLRPTDGEIGSSDRDYEIIYANLPAAALANMTPGEMIGGRLSEVLPRFGSGFRDAITEAERTGNAVHRMTEKINPKVNSRRAEYQVLPFDGLLAFSVIDRSREFDAESESDFLRKLLEAGITASLTPTALLRPVVNSEGKTVDIVFEQANAAAATLLGRSVGEVVGRALYSLMPPNNGGLLALVEECRVQGRLISADYDARTASIDSDWLRVNLIPVGELVILNAEDVSVQRREEGRLRAILQHASELVVYSNSNGFLEFVNPFTLQLLGYDVSQIVGKSILDFTLPSERDVVFQDYLGLVKGSIETARRRIRLVDASGRVRTLIGTTQTLRSPSGGVDGFVTVAADLTELVAREEESDLLAAELSIAEQRERDRLAADLHDGPVQELAALSMQLGAALSVQPHPVLQNAENQVIKVISDLRALMFELSPLEVDGEELEQAIKNRGIRLFEGTGVQFKVDVSLQQTPSPTASVMLFRLAQESMVNARKHANAESVNVRISDDVSRGVVLLDIVDDGDGADPSDYERNIAGHFGVTMMIDRARQLGGTCTVRGNPGIGTHVHVELPLT